MKGKTRNTTCINISIKHQHQHQHQQCSSPESSSALIVTVVIIIIVILIGTIQCSSSTPKNLMLSRPNLAFWPVRLISIDDGYALTYSSSSPLGPFSSRFIYFTIYSPLIGPFHIPIQTTIHWSLSILVLAFSSWCHVDVGRCCASLTFSPSRPHYIDERYIYEMCSVRWGDSWWEQRFATDKI